MKEKTKEFLKKYLIGFILGFVSVGIVVVYAETYFPSNDVTYDNTESGLSSTDVQGAIDELYGVCTAVPAGETIIEDAGLEKDPYECRYFFTGANPNNYVTFNGENAGWRIISVECDGTIKIMRSNSIGRISWDSHQDNIWESASLNTYLNGNYFDRLNSTAQSQIVAKDWSIGAVKENNNNLAQQINNENGTKWNGKVALPTASEYLRSNSNKSNCETMYKIYSGITGQCKGTTWMYYSYEEWWTLSPVQDFNYKAFSIYMDSSYADISTTTALAVRPALYLKSDVKLSGNGTKSDPYVVK